MLGHSTLWTSSIYSSDLSWRALLAESVNDCLPDICQVSNLPHDCVAYWPRLRDQGNLCKCLELISWLGCDTVSFQNSIFSETLNLGFSSSVSLNHQNWKKLQFEIFHSIMILRVPLFETSYKSLKLLQDIYIFWAVPADNVWCVDKDFRIRHVWDYNTSLCWNVLHWLKILSNKCFDLWKI